MSVPEPPMDLNKWDLPLLDQLINYPSIESETFDFKGPKLNELEIHICAMSNTSGGIIVLGIEDSAPGRPFVKIGFDPGRKNSIINDIRNYAFMVEPHPKYDLKPIDDPVNDRFYMILKVEKKRDQDLPHAIKNKGQYFVRVGASTSPASPTIIANLFSDIRGKIRDVNLLRSSCLATRNSFMMTSHRISYRNTTSTSSIPPVELDLLKKATIEAEWFLVEKDLLGLVADSSSRRSGMYTHLDDLAQLNSYIEAFNRTLHPHDKEKFLPDLKPWEDNYSGYTAMVQFLDGVIKKCEEFLKERSS